MKLKRLELNGFKSFADRTEIVFGQGITGIVGPNGSGKSNIGDAVRWVLGEQSPKTLRGARMEDVIFGGTQTRRRSSYCEVSLIFDNEDGKLKSAFSEVCVTRRVYRDGDSEYQLNHVSCRLKDIQELFRDTGIGREGYSLIGQGRIDEILSQKSEDRRQVFEEAAGIMTYRVRKEEAERKLSRTAENLSRVYDIIDEIERHLDQLGTEAEIAKEYRALFDRMRFLEANLYLVRYDKLNDRIAQLTNTLERLHNTLLADQARLTDLNAQRETLDAEIAQVEQEVSAARLTYSAQLQETHDAEIQAERLQNELEQTSHDAEQTELNVSAFRTELEQLNEQLSVDTLRQAELRDETSQAKEKLDRALQATTEAQQKADAAEDELNRHKTKILNAVRQQMDAREAQSRQAAIREQMLSRISELETAVESLRAQHALLEEQTALDREDCERIAHSLEETRKEHESISGRLSGLNEKSRAATATAQQANIVLQADISRLKLMEEMSRDMTGYQQSVKKALDFAGHDKGVYGVVAKLIEVPERFETAIDMALGGALQNIVTDNEETAKRMIDYLRVNKLGRATFLPVSSIRSRTLSQEERKLLNMPGCLGVASDLISFDPQFRGIIESMLGRTVIADTLDHGIPIMRAGHHAFRLVTLVGDVMHSGGSMTGGTTQNRTVSLLGREREIKDLRDRIRTEKEHLEQQNASLLDLNQECQQAKADENECLARIQELEIRHARLRERVQSDEQDSKEFYQRVTDTESAREQLKASVADIDRDIAEANEAAASEASSNEELEQRTSELQQAMLQLREQAEAQRTQLTEDQLSLNTLMHQLEALNRRIADAEKRRGDNARKMTDANIRLKSLTEQIARLKTLAADSDIHVAELRSKHESSLRIVDVLEARRADKLSEQRQLNQALEEAHQQSETDNTQIHKAELSLTKSQSDLTQMTDHLLNAYDLSYTDAQNYRSETPIELGKADQEVAELRARIREMGSVNTAAIEKYETEMARYKELTAQRDDLLKAREDLESLIKRLLRQMEGIFTTEFAKLDTHFKETFVRLFGGGQAELKLTEADDPLNCGIEIIAQPPGKKLQLLSLLSGGERALTAIAILFAMLKLKPTPFCILDEIEAALDDSNIDNFANYLSEYAQTTQFVVITHRKGTMECCDGLYGVAMEEKGVSRMVSVNLADYPN